MISVCVSNNETIFSDAGTDSPLNTRRSVDIRLYGRGVDPDLPAVLDVCLLGVGLEGLPEIWMAKGSKYLVKVNEK